MERAAVALRCSIIEQRQNDVLHLGLQGRTQSRMSRITCGDNGLNRRGPRENVYLQGTSLRRIAVKTTFCGGFAIALGLVAAAVPVLAHHSFAAEFDGTKQV